MSYNLEYEKIESLPLDMALLDKKGNVLYDGFDEANEETKKQNVNMLSEKIKKGQKVYILLNGEDEPRELSFDVKSGKFSMSEQLTYDKGTKLTYENQDEKVEKPSYSVFAHIKNFFHRWVSNEDLPEIQEYNRKYAEYKKYDDKIKKSKEITEDIIYLSTSIRSNKLLEKRPITLFNPEKVRYTYENATFRKDYALADFKKIEAIEGNMLEIAKVNLKKIKGILNENEVDYLSEKQIDESIICIANLTTLDRLNKTMQGNSMSDNSEISGNLAMKKLMDGAGKMAKDTLKKLNFLSKETKLNLISRIDEDKEIKDTSFINSFMSPDVTEKAEDIFSNPESLKNELNNKFKEIKNKIAGEKDAGPELIGKACALKQMYKQLQNPNSIGVVNEELLKFEKYSEKFADEFLNAFPENLQKEDAVKNITDMYDLSKNSDTFERISQNIQDRRQKEALDDSIDDIEIQNNLNKQADERQNDGLINFIH